MTLWHGRNQNLIRGRSKRTPGQMNKLEQRWREQLEFDKRNGEVLWYEYEPLRLRLAPATHYTPDFLVVHTSGEVTCDEVKGTWRKQDHAHWDQAGRVKIKLAAEKYWWFIFRAITWNAKQKVWEFEHFTPEDDIVAG